jgi:phytoene dehydrogenase-like protein
MKRFYDNYVVPQFHFEEKFVPQNTEFLSQFHNRSYRDFLDPIVPDATMRNLLYGQWPYCGASPEYGPTLFFFMMLTMHCIEGSHYCKGGFATLASALASVITERGGEVKTGSLVTTLHAEEKKIRLVKTANGDEYEAGIVVSNISPALLHNSVLDPKARGGLWQKRTANLQPSISSVIAYLGLKKGFERIIPSHINFWYATTDFHRIFLNILENKKEAIDHLIVLKTMEYEHNPTLTLMNFVQKTFSNNWKIEKTRIADLMFQKAWELWPGLKEYVELVEVGSPATFERYTLNTSGALYGYENIKHMYGEAKMPVHTHLDNLFQTGHWGKPGGGVWNVMSNAYVASKTILQRV